MIHRWKVTAAMFLIAVCAHSQSPIADSAPDWAIHLGASVLNKGGATMPGWMATVAEYPYSVCPWLGGAIEADGYYKISSVAGASSLTGTYLVMGGPSARFYRHGLSPFIHAEFGGLAEKTDVTGTVTSTQSMSEFAMAFGGGGDFAVRQHLAVNVGADWVRAGISNGTNIARASGGLAVRF